MITSVAVGDTPSQVLPTPGGTPYKFVAIGNVGGKTAYLKLVPDSTQVTVSNGIPLPAGTSIVCDQDSQRELFDGGAYAVTAAGETTTISVQAF
jgi:hypothetical protein